MKKKVVLAVVFVLLILGTVILSCEKTEAKDYKKKIETGKTTIKKIKLIYGQDTLKIKLNSKKKYKIEAKNTKVANIDKKGNIELLAIGDSLINIYDEYGYRHEFFIKCRPSEFFAEDLTVKVGDTFKAKLNLGGAQVTDDFDKAYYLYHNGSEYEGEEIVHVNYENGLPLGNVTALKPGTVKMTIKWKDCICSFTVTVIE